MSDTTTCGRVLKRRSVQRRKQLEVLTMCDGYQPIRDANKLLRELGLVFRLTKRSLETGETAGGDRRYLRLERLVAR